MYPPSQWETALQCNAISYWLDAYTEWSLHQRKHQSSMLLALCEWNPSVISGFPSQRTSNSNLIISLYPRPTKLEGGILDSPCPSVRPSVRPSVCRRHGFRSISQVCFGISISNFICMLMVAIGRSLLIFSDVTFKMAAWRPYWIFWFPDSNFT